MAHTVNSTMEQKLNQTQLNSIRLDSAKRNRAYSWFYNLTVTSDGSDQVHTVWTPDKRGEVLLLHRVEGFMNFAATVDGVLLWDNTTNSAPMICEAFLAGSNAYAWPSTYNFNPPVEVRTALSISGLNTNTAKYTVNFFGEVLTGA